MPEYDNEMRGVLFRNKDKTPGDDRPNAKGEIQINGVRYWVSAWTKTKRDSDEKYQQLRVEVAEPKYQPNQQAAPQNAAPAAQPPAPQPDPDADIPF